MVDVFFFFKQKTAYELRISDWSSDVCSSDLYVPVMVAAILLAVAVMLLAARPLGHFIDNNPTIKMLALAFIVLIGAYLLVDGLGLHMPKGYIYGAMGFS